VDRGDVSGILVSTYIRPHFVFCFRSSYYIITNNIIYNWCYVDPRCRIGFQDATPLRLFSPQSAAYVTQPELSATTSQDAQFAPCSDMKCLLCDHAM
jgi:hypothetical protein